MATLSTLSLNWLAREWEKSYKSAVLSGIVGDLAHKARGGYHISREDQGKGNYSVIRADDKPGNGPSDRASAIDMTMSTADIVKCHVRLRESWKNRAKDPRWKYINAWNGWDGKGSAGRYDVVTGNVSTATADHKWHCVPVTTKILTQRGWLSYDEIKIGVDKTLGFDRNTGQTAWTLITDIVTNEDQEVFEFSNRGAFTLQASSEHRWLTYRYSQPEAGVTFKTTKNLKSRDTRILLGQKYPDAKEPVELSVSECELLGWIISDGSQHISDSQRHLNIWQTKSVGRERLIQLLNEAGWNFGTSGPRGFNIHKSTQDSLFARLGFTQVKKDVAALTDLIVNKTTQAQREAILQGIVGGDGSTRTAGGFNIYQSEGELLPVIELLIASTGRLATKKGRGLEHHKLSQKTPYVLSVKTNAVIDAARINPVSVGRQKTWCPVTELETWTAGYEHGPIVLTGNCHLEIRRKYVNDMNAMRAILSLLKGEPAGGVEKPPVVTPKPPIAVPKPVEEEIDMPLTDSEIAKIADAVWKKEFNIEVTAGKPANMQQAGGILRYTSSEHHKAISLATQILSKLDGDLVDENAIAVAILSNPAFVDGLATAVAAKLPAGVDVTPEELADALKTALREGVAAD